MILIYILLGIIAVAVLLLSPQGKRILRNIGILGLFLFAVISLIFLCVAGYALFTSGEFRWWYEHVIGYLIAVVIVGVNIFFAFSKLLENKGEIKEAWKSKRKYSVAVSTLVVVILVIFCILGIIIVKSI